MDQSRIRVKTIGTLEGEVLIREIPHIKVTTDVESIDLYRLGLYRNGTHGDGKEEMIELVKLRPKQQYPPHIHPHSQATLYMITGEGEIILNGLKHHYSPGNTFSIAKGISHGFKVKTATLLLSIQRPPIIHPETGNVDIEYLT